MSGEFGTGKTIFVLAIVVGCFAVLWPKIFYPMLTASVKSPTSARQAAVGWKNQANSEFLQQLCYLLEEHSGARWSHEAECWLFLESSCHLELNESMLQDYRLGKDKTSFTDCLGINYGLSPNIVTAAVLPKVRPRSYTPQVPWSYVQGDLKSVDLDDDVIEPWADLKTTRKDEPSIIKPGSAHHVRPERPAHLYPEMMHPALREKGRVMPQRTVDKNPRPGPMPGMRPTMGGAGGIVPPPQGKGSGAMGIIMPLYTVGIVVFFVYTIMKVLFKKGSDDDKAPKLKDFGMDPEYRKYVFAEEYLDNQNISTKSEFRRQQREDSRQRRKQVHEVPDTKIEDEQMDHLRRRLEDTEVAMERLMNQMGSVTDKLTAAKITEVLSQAQAQAKILKIGLDNVMDSAAAAEAIYKAKDEAADLSFGSDDLTTSEALTTTMSDETSFPSALHRHLQDLQNEEKTSSKDSSPDMEEYEVITKEGVEKKSSRKQSKESSPISTTETEELKEETESKTFEPASTTITPTTSKQDDTIMITASHKEEEDIIDITDKKDEPYSQISPATAKIDESLSQISPSTAKIEESLSDLSPPTAKTDESLSQISPDTADTTDKVESDISDTSSTVESKKEVKITEKLSADDLSSTKPVIDEEKSIGKVEE